MVMSMVKQNMRIEIVSSSYNAYSSMGGNSRESIRSVLAKHYSDVRISIVNQASDLEAIAERNPDLVFLGMKFAPTDVALGLEDPEKVWVSDYLDQHGIAYTGSNQLAHELERDKAMAKKRVLDAGLLTSAFYVARKGDVFSAQDFPLDFPLLLSPQIAAAA